MDVVEKWIESEILAMREHGETSIGARLLEANGWERLVDGELGELAFDAAARAGSMGWPWVERPGAKRSEKRAALRAVCLNDTPEVARLCSKLDRLQAARALCVALRDERTPDVECWSAIALTWPLALELGHVPPRRCEDWSALARIASACSEVEALRFSRVFLESMGARDTRGQTLAEAWLVEASQKGSSLSYCARSLAAELGSRAAADSSHTEARMALAHSAGHFLSAQADPRLSCACSSFWEAWRALGDGGAQQWEAWISTMWIWAKSASSNSKRSCSSSWLCEALRAHQDAGSPLRAKSSHAMPSLVGISKMLMEAWHPLAGEAKPAERRYHMEAIGGSLVDWAKDLGPDQVLGWSKRVDEVSLAGSEYASILERQLLEEDQDDVSNQASSTQRARRI